MKQAVWLVQPRCWGELLMVGAYYSLVRWFEPDTNVEIEDWVENDDYDTWEERTIEFEPDE